MSGLRVFPLLLVRGMRLVPWWHIGLGLVAAFGLAATRRTTYLDDTVFGLRVAAVALAASAAFVFDDPAVNLLDSKPVAAWMQRTARVVVAFPAVVAGWWILVTWMEAPLRADDQVTATVPHVALSIEMAALLGIVWAAAMVTQRSGTEGGGLVAAPALLVVVVVLLLLPERWSVFASPAAPPLPGEAASLQWEAWIDAHRRWAALSAASWTVVVVGLRGTTRHRRRRWHPTRDTEYEKLRSR